MSFIKLLYSIHVLLFIVIGFYSFDRSIKDVFKKNKNILKFFFYRDWITKVLFVIGFFCFLVYVFIKGYVFFMLNGNPLSVVCYALSILEPLILSIVGSVIFYLIFSGLQDRTQFKNGLIQLSQEYKVMKYEVMRLMILVQNNWSMPKNFDEMVESLSQSPLKAQEYFSYAIFQKILQNLDGVSTLQILRYMQNFLKTLGNIKNRFEQKGILDLYPVYQVFKDYEMKLEAMLLDKQKYSSSIALDWTDDFELKSVHVLYLLFCMQDQQGGDPNIEIFERVKQKYLPF